MVQSNAAIQSSNFYCITFFLIKGFSGLKLEYQNTEHNSNFNISSYYYKNIFCNSYFQLLINFNYKRVILRLKFVIIYSYLK